MRIQRPGSKNVSIPPAPKPEEPIVSKFTSVLPCPECKIPKTITLVEATLACMCGRCGKIGPTGKTISEAFQLWNEMIIDSLSPQDTAQAWAQVTLMLPELEAIKNKLKITGDPSDVRIHNANLAYVEVAQMIIRLKKAIGA